MKPQRILVFDNYDSFTYNLVHLIRELGYGQAMEIHRNDKISLQEVSAFDKILLSPGPGIPSEAGILLQVIETFAPTKSILGVCLGHQAIGEVFGATLLNMKNVLHGIATPTQVDDTDEILFQGVPGQFLSARYHSWMIDRYSMGSNLKVTATDHEGAVMALKHVEYDVRGVQFHPESVLTEHGKQMMHNWLQA
jgi:anthranilate synthase component II